MKCEICGSELMLSDSECKYCGNKIIPHFDVHKQTDSSYETELDTPKSEFTRRNEEKYRSMCKYCGRELNSVTHTCDHCQNQARRERETDTEYTKENDMARKRADRQPEKKSHTNTSRRNGRKKKKSNPFKTAFIITLLMIILFAVSFTVFFRMLGGSFLPEKEEVVTPTPKPTAQVTRVVQTPQPTQEPTSTPQPTENERPTQEPTPKPTVPPEKRDVLNTGKNSYAYPSDEEIISEDELETMTRQEIKIILQEIYARHGYTFNEDDLIEYFENKNWYMPTETDVEKVEEKFNDVELENKEIIEDYQRKKGWRI